MREMCVRMAVVLHSAYGYFTLVAQGPVNES
jgi:hypothetical protein